MVFQSYALYPHMTVAQNMGFALKLKKVGKQEIATRVRRGPPRLLGPSRPTWTASPTRLSGGQRQRVAMGRAHRPRAGGVS